MSWVLICFGKVSRITLRCQSGSPHPASTWTAFRTQPVWQEGLGAENLHATALTHGLQPQRSAQERAAAAARATTVRISNLVISLTLGILDDSGTGQNTFNVFSALISNTCLCVSPILHILLERYQHLQGEVPALGHTCKVSLSKLPKSCLLLPITASFRGHEALRGYNLQRHDKKSVESAECSSQWNLGTEILVGHCVVSFEPVLTAGNIWYCSGLVSAAVAVLLVNSLMARVIGMSLWCTSANSAKQIACVAAVLKWKAWTGSEIQLVRAP